MKNGEDIRRYTVAELEARQAGGESRTDLARVRAKTEEELERDIASDPDWCDVPRDWCRTAVAVRPASRPRVLAPRQDHPRRLRA